jgi:osmotically-inducible protein OsmY
VRLGGTVFAVKCARPVSASNRLAEEKLVEKGMIMKKMIQVLVCTAALAAGLTGCNQTQTGTGTGSAGVLVDDKTLQASVESALANNPNYKFSDVKVMVSGGTVQLSGFVNTQEQKDKAVDVAKGVSGAKDVQNSISLKPATP